MVCLSTAKIINNAEVVELNEGNGMLSENDLNDIEYLLNKEISSLLVDIAVRPTLGL